MQSLLKLVFLLPLLTHALASPANEHVTENVERREILPSLFCRHHTSTCIRHTITKTSTETKTRTKTIATTCPPRRTITSTATKTEIITTTVSSNPKPTFNCPPEGYIISVDGLSLYSINITTGERTLVKQGLGTGGAFYNALGYNILDNTFWATDINNGLIIHIFADGSIESLGNGSAANIGDVDLKGNYWTSELGQGWWHYDVNPSSPGYGTLVESGVSDPPPQGRVNDWVNVPITGPYFYSIVADGTTQQTSIVRWNSNTHVWSLFASYPQLTASNWAPFWAANNGTIYAENVDTGIIYNFPLFGNAQPFVIAQGGTEGTQDAARCVLNLHP